ncbi:MAG: agmatine deiminase family protein [Alphaproteobacteria bacterium]|jgi:agmatine deiminase|nr:agmatine deiminase family protein [Alphaproteobacteria bacterium]QQS58073.1 MAG: agmatine deiminase family protein [Alphaproteobacteria bacterium]
MKTGIYIPAEWEPQQDIWTAWPSHDDDDRWPGERLALARSEVAQMVRALAQGQKVIILACGDESLADARAQIGDVAAVVPALFGDTWLRDTGPVFGYDPAGRLTALRFGHNGWGGKFIYEHDDTVGDFIAEQSGAHIRRFDFILEGGAIEHDGKGTILTTRQCVLNPNRNKNWSEQDAEAALRESFGAKRIVWLDDGLLNDHTDGHIDNLARFVAPGLIACPEAFGDDDPNEAVYEKTAQTLIAEGFEIVRIPSPGLVRDESGLIVPASHMNFVIGNKAVVMPCYGTESEGAALDILQKLFPSRTVSAVRSHTLLTGGGSFHCITQQVPVIRSSGKDEI